MTRYHILSALILTTSSVAAADTIFPGGVLPGAANTWTKANSPYVLYGDLTIPAGATLTIEAGVEVRAAGNSDSQGSGFDTSRVELLVRGSLFTNGTAAEPVVLRSTSSTNQSWYGVYTSPLATSVSLTHTTIQHAVYGMRIDSPGTVVEVSNLTVVGASSGIWVREGSPRLNRFMILSSGNGVKITDVGTPTLTNCVIQNSSAHGVSINRAPVAGTVTVRHCTIDRSGFANVHSISTSGIGTNVNITSSILTNANQGVSRNDSSNWWVTNCNVWGNDTNFERVSSANNISADPQYVSATDLHLKSTSVAIDRGATGPSDDFDGVARPQDGNGVGGAEWDLGAYEYVRAVCGNGAVEPGEACDDGNAVNTDACLTTCTNASCGDGHVRAGVEECDDGNPNDDDECLPTCAMATCGDGAIRVGFEDCDDGNTNDDDACTNTCVSTTCGDGIKQSIEQCDDGNTIETDGCRQLCIAAACGDGIVYDGVEDCDDGNVAAGDGCSPACKVESSTSPDAGVDNGNGMEGGDGGGGGGCATTGSAPMNAWWLGLAMLLFVRRRRRA
ncbi:MAG: DUF4215 domain-containing protein [Kofleriaceae bacterium]